ncbi:MAG: NADH-quinone oxidoreductase subunit NuoG [Anaerolineae bacterium]|nr:NADH-quinone oxidoreductase subunit NuoG [Anaerolineae bacterium]MDW8100642.1 NADH-quinone oxidoreductase subunit NuoG [Anaerolineae bacterium]
MTELVTFQIDGKAYQAPKGIPLTRAAKANGIEIPTFCAHPKLDPIGACRMCMVEIEGPRGRQLVTACTTPVAEGLVVYYNSPRAREAREATLEFILINHPLDCPICDKGGECPLQNQTMEHGPGMSRFIEEKIRKDKHHPISDLILLDQERCVVCWRCTRYLAEWEYKPELGLYHRGGETVIDTHPNQMVTAKTSGNIIDICPVGALTNRIARFHYRPWAVTPVPSICTHCSQGCNLRFDVRTHEIRRIVARENMAVNDQWICDKGRFAQGYFHHPDRLAQPLVREQGALRPATWEEALQRTVDGLSRWAREQPQRVGAIGSSKVSNEASYLLQKFMRLVVGTNNIDHRWGGDVLADPRGLSAIADVHSADLFVLVGVHLAEEQPVLANFFKRAVRRSGAQALILHPRRTEDADFGIHLPIQPGTEAVILNSLMALLVQRERFAGQAQRIAGAREFLTSLQEFTPEAVAALSGVPIPVLRQAADLLAQSERVLVLYGPDVVRGRAAEANAAALANLELLIGQGRVAYLGPEANSQGARDMGLLPTHLPGHVSVTDAAARERLQRLWGGEVPAQPGLTYTQMLQAAARGELKALLVMGADPAAEGTWAAMALEQLDFLVVQDVFLTETAKRAHVVLPATTYAETDGTFTNLERRVQRAPQAFRPYQQARPDWKIIVDLAHCWPVREGAEASAKGKKEKGKKSSRPLRELWVYHSPQEVLQEITRAVPQYAGLTWEVLGDQGKQWPLGDVSVSTRFRVVSSPLRAAGDDFPFRLVADRLLYDHGTLIRTTERFRNLLAAPVARMNPSDMERVGLHNGAEAQITSAHGIVILAVQPDQTVLPGTVVIAYSLPGAPAETLMGPSGPGVPVKVTTAC